MQPCKCPWCGSDMHSGMVDGKPLYLCPCGVEGDGDTFFRCGPIHKDMGDTRRPREDRCNWCGSEGKLKSLSDVVWWMECTGCGSVPAKCYDRNDPDMLWPRWRWPRPHGIAWAKHHC
jgi:hypothetical protein